MNIRIKRLSEAAVIPEYKTPGAAAFDLATTEGATLAPGEIHRFPTGLVFCIPAGHFMLVASRSSNSIKKGISMANGIGVIDSDYCGENDELHVLIQNIIDQPVTIATGDRIAQAMILPVERVAFEEVTSTGAENRGGLGTTGR